MSACRTCGAPIVWAVNRATGKLAPFDAATGAGGSWRLDEIGDHGGPAAVYSPGSRDGHHSHFATCPDADRHRRSR